MRFFVLAAAMIAALITGECLAQSLEGFSVGKQAAAQLKAMPRPQEEAPVGENVARAWTIGPGLRLSVTVSPASGNVLFVEKDWSIGTAPTASGVPGLIFGTTRLSDIRERFGSNGFGFRANTVMKISDGLAMANCFGIADHDDLVLVVITAIHRDEFAAMVKHPDTGRGTLETIILADRKYLDSIWGDEIRPDPKYHPVKAFQPE